MNFGNILQHDANKFLELENNADGPSDSLRCLPLFHDVNYHLNIRPVRTTSEEEMPWRLSLVDCSCSFQQWHPSDDLAYSHVSETKRNLFQRKIEMNIHTFSKQTINDCFLFVIDVVENFCSFEKRSRKWLTTPHLFLFTEWPWGSR